MELSSLAHEIINPLNIIIGCAELSKLENIPDDVSYHIDEIIRQSLWCCQLLKTEISETNKNTQDLDIINNLQNIVNDAKNHPLIKKKNININLVISDELPNTNFYVKINPIYFKIIIDNFILNAIKHGVKGDEIIIKMQERKHDVIIEVSNLISNNISNIPKSQYDNKSSNGSYHQYLNKSNGYGLTVIDKLVSKMSATWNFHQDKNRIKTNLILPII